MNIFSEIKWLIKKDFLLEWRNKNAFYATLLYLGCTTFICYLSVGIRGNGISPLTWNALFWIILLFTSINGVSKSFLSDSKRMIYYYTIVSPQSVIIAKIIYNAALLSILSLLGLGMYAVVLDNPVNNGWLFVINVLIGSAGFASTFTLIAGIAGRAGNPGALMAVLSIPLIIPMLLLLMKVSKMAVDGLTFSSAGTEILLLVAINFMVLGLSYILFPYLWRS